VTELIISNKAPGFDYAALPTDTTEILQSTASRIRDRMCASIVETGRDLIKIKSVLEHGAFGAWLNAEIGMTERTAQNYMSAAELAGKYETVSYLPAAALYRLAAPSTPEAARAAIVDRLDRGETVSKLEISDTIAKAKWEKAEAERLAKIAPAELKRMRLRKEQRERKWEADRLEREREEQEEKQAARRAITILRDRLSGDQFNEFVALVRASSFSFRDELDKAVQPTREARI
jgi:hypothetical protein